MAGDKAMLLAQRTALLVILCCEDELVDSGSLTVAEGKPSPLVKILESYLKVFRQGQVALGLGSRRGLRVGETGPTMEEIVQEYRSKATSASISRRVGGRMISRQTND